MSLSLNTKLIILLLLFVVTPAFSQGYGIKTIVIDAGHGGKDPGAVGKRAKEKDIALNVALLTGGYIEKNIPGIKVVYTRKKDVFIGLRERAHIAQRAEADLFVSIHVNAVENRSVYGSSTFVLGLHRADDNFKIAQKENAVIELEENFEETYQGFDPNKPESYIIFNFINNHYLEQSMALAGMIQSQFKSRVGRKDRGVYQDGFLVLRETSMPSVLVELGFITNSTEELYLTKKKNQEYMASAIYRAVRDYKNKIDALEEADVPVVKVEKKVSNKVTPSGDIVFRLQFLLSKKSLKKNNRNFKGLNNVWEYKSGVYYKYTLGKSTNLQEMLLLQKKYKSRFPDAFVVAFKNGERIPVSQAKKELGIN